VEERPSPRRKKKIKITKNTIPNDGQRLQSESLSGVKTHFMIEWITYRNNSRQGEAKGEQLMLARVHLADKQEK
jgi:hypothetical protein